MKHGNAKLRGVAELETGAEDEGLGFSTGGGKSATEEGGESKRRPPRYTVLITRLAIMTLFAVTVTLLSIFTWFWTSQSTKQAANSLGDSLRHNILNGSVVHMTRILSDQQSALNVTVNAAMYQHQLTGEVLGSDMRREVWGVVANRNYAFTSSTVLASAYFQSLNPGQPPQESFVNISYSPEETPTIYNVSLDAYGNRIGPVGVLTTDLDPRQRDYYLGAQNLSTGQVHWSLYYSARSFPVLSASTPLRDGTGDFLGVKIVIQQLGSVSNFVTNMWDMRGGMIFFMTSDGFLLASSGPREDFLNNYELGGRLRRATESTCPLIRSTDHFLMKEFGMPGLLSGPIRVGDVQLEGQKYYVDTVPIENGNLQMVAVLAIPRESIMGSIDNRSRVTAIMLCCLSSAAFLIGCVLVFLFTKRVSTEVKLKAELEEAKQRAEAHSKAKSMFLSNVSHELRTPMAGILGLLDLLSADEMLPEQATNVDQIRQCATYLLGLLNNLLDLGKIEAGKLELESADFDLVAELESLVDMFAVQCTAQGIEIGLELPGEMNRLVKGDQTRLRQIVVNLLSNAIKFSSPGGHVLVRASPNSSSGSLRTSASDAADAVRSSRESGSLFSPRFSFRAKEPSEASERSPPSRPSERSPPLIPSERSQPSKAFERSSPLKGSERSSPSTSGAFERKQATRLWYTFEVEDDGIGIPPEKREMVFENFAQADSSTTRLHGGTGLGLAIVRSLVHMMEGDISVVDKDGPGTLIRFQVSFEATCADAAGAPEGAQSCPIASATEPVCRGGNVLLAMPEALGRGIAERYLRKEGFDVRTATTWADVIPQAEQLIAPGNISNLVGVAAAHAENGLKHSSRPEDSYGGHISSAGAECELGASGHIVIDMETAEGGPEGGAEHGTCPTLVIIDVSTVPSPAGPKELGECLRQLERIQPRAVVAWLVSSDTPVSVRQMLKASSPVANKPLYASRLSELLLAMTSHGGELLTSEMTSAACGLQTCEHVASDVSPARPSNQLTSAGTQSPATKQVVKLDGGGFRTSEPLTSHAAQAWTSGKKTEPNKVENLVSSEKSAAHQIKSPGTEPAVGRNDNADQIIRSLDRALHESQPAATCRAALSSPVTSTVTLEQATGSAPGISMASRSGSGRATAAPISSQSTVRNEPDISVIDRTRAPRGVGEQQSNEGGSPKLPLAGLRILVAEDTPILQKLAVKTLSKLGASVHAVGDGQQASDAVAGANCAAERVSHGGTDGLSVERPFDVVLMDCQMPVMDGYEATRAIRQAEEGTGKYTPIIALTAHAMASDRDKCLAVGMDSYLAKPIQQKELVAAIKSIVATNSPK